MSLPLAGRPLVASARVNLPLTGSSGLTGTLATGLAVTTPLGVDLSAPPPAAALPPATRPSRLACSAARFAALMGFWGLVRAAGSGSGGVPESQATTRRTAAAATTEGFRLMRAIVSRLGPTSRGVDLDLLSRDDAVRTAPARVELEHVRRWAGNAPGVVVHRRHLLVDSHDRSVPRDEQHIERDTRVAHPERTRTLVVPAEQHAFVVGHRGAVHQAPLTVTRLPGDLHGDAGLAGSVGERDVAARQIEVARGVGGTALGLLGDRRRLLGGGDDRTAWARPTRAASRRPVALGEPWPALGGGWCSWPDARRPAPRLGRTPRRPLRA